MDTPHQTDAPRAASHPGAVAMPSDGADCDPIARRGQAPLPGGLGQWQESGRDQGHATLGVCLAGAFCEMAWNQGQDMYGYSDNRIMAGFEYIAKYNLGQDVPFTT